LGSQNKEKWYRKERKEQKEVDVYTNMKIPKSSQGDSERVLHHLGVVQGTAAVMSGLANG